MKDGLTTLSGQQAGAGNLEPPATGAAHRLISRASDGVSTIGGDAAQADRKRGKNPRRFPRLSRKTRERLARETRLYLEMRGTLLPRKVKP